MPANSREYAREYARQWRAKNREHINEYNREWRAREPETIDHEWRAEAACKGCDIGIFYPKGNEPDYTEARKICVTCPVKSECLHAAMHEEKSISSFYRYGMRGGRTPEQRYAVYKRRGKACEWCGATVNPRRRRVSAKYCSEACAEAVHNKQKLSDKQRENRRLYAADRKASA